LVADAARKPTLRGSVRVGGGAVGFSMNGRLAAAA
jgi:hypothetical protein